MVNCCLSLRIGSTVIATYYLLQSIGFVILGPVCFVAGILMMGGHLNHFNQDSVFLRSHEYLGRIAVIYGGSLLALGILSLVFTSLLIHGIDKRVSRFLTVWMYFRIVMVLVWIIKMIVLSVYFSDGIYTSAIPCLLLEVYFIIHIKYFRNEMMEELQRLPTQQLYNTYKA